MYKSSEWKAVAGFHEKYITVKLDKETEQETLAFDGVEIFNPSGKRPMNGWLQVPIHYAEKWNFLVKKAFDFVKMLYIIYFLNQITFHF